jgi:hypothetical protein
MARIYHNYSVSWKAIIASVIHAIIVQTARILPSFSTPIYELSDTGVEDTVFIIVLIIILVASVLLYLYTGIPFSIFTKKCGECGETSNAGETWCDNCGSINGVEALGLQAAWLITGYATISTLSLYFFLWPTFIRNFEYETSPYLVGFGIVPEYIIIACVWLFVLLVSANICWYISIFRHDTN